MYDNANTIEPEFAPYEYNELLLWYRKAWRDSIVELKLVDNTNYD